MYNISSILQSFLSLTQMSLDQTSLEEKVKLKLEKLAKDAETQMFLQKDNPRFEEALFIISHNSSNYNQIDFEESNSLKEGVAFCQGQRPTMEDAHLMTSFQHEGLTAKLFGIFDGHGGADASLFCKDNLESYLKIKLQKFGVTCSGIFNALKETFEDLNKNYQGKDGTTATVAFIYNGDIWVANVGDSRTVLDLGGKPIQLSEDAKPGMLKYKKGIAKRGGILVSTGKGEYRLLGECESGGKILLAVPRAIGDHYVPGVCPRAKISLVSKETIQENKKKGKGTHLILACDGLYDVASTSQVVKWVEQNHGTLTPCELSKVLASAAFQAGSKDNISVMVVQL